MILLRIIIMGGLLGLWMFYWHSSRLESSWVIKATLQSDTPVDMQFFWSQGKGYSEETSTRFSIDHHNNIKSISCRVGKKIPDSIRFDPCVSTGSESISIEIKSLRLEMDDRMGLKLRPSQIAYLKEISELNGVEVNISDDNLLNLLIKPNQPDPQLSWHVKNLSLLTR